MRAIETTRFRKSLIAVALVSLFAIAACSSGADSTGQSSAGNTAAANLGATLRYAHNSGFGILDPQMSPDFVAGQLAMRPIYDSLLTLTKTAGGSIGPAPQLATSWEVSSDGLAVTLQLRTGVTFQDGTPFNAQAVKANLDRALGAGSTIKGLLPSIAGVETTGDSTVVLHLSKPDESVLWALATNTTGMMASPAAFATLRSAPVGTGPYKLVSSTDSAVTYERWDGYWNKEVALAQKIVISTVPDVNARFNGVRSDQYDMAFLASPMDAQAKSLTSQGYHWNQSLSPINTGVLLNNAMKPFDDVRVRQAVSMAINRAQITRNLLNGMNPPAYQTFLKGYIGYDPSLEQDPYNLDQAKQLIQQAGAVGQSVDIIYPASAPYDAIASVVEQELTDAGLKVTLTPADNAQARAMWRTGKYSAAVLTNTGSVDPSTTLNGSYLGGDNVAPPPPELVRMAADANKLPVGSDAQNVAYQAISKYLQQNPIHIPILQFGAVYLARRQVVGSDNFSLNGVAAAADFRGVGVTS